MMFKKNKEMKMMTSLALFVSIVGLVFAYIAMSVVLEIKNPVDTWSVNFSDLVEERVGMASSVLPKLNSTSITDFMITFIKPGDSVTYRFKVKNTGNVGARLKVIGEIRPDCVVNQNNDNSVCENVEYNLTYADGRKVSTGDILVEGTNTEMLFNVI